MKWDIKHKQPKPYSALSQAPRRKTQATALEFCRKYNLIYSHIGAFDVFFQFPGKRNIRAMNWETAFDLLDGLAEWTLPSEGKNEHMDAG